MRGAFRLSSAQVRARISNYFKKQRWTAILRQVYYLLNLMMIKWDWCLDFLIYEL